MYIDIYHYFYLNDYVYKNEKNSKEINFNKKLFLEIKNLLHDHVYNEQTNEEILLINKMCTKLKEKKIWNT